MTTPSPLCGKSSLVTAALVALLSILVATLWEVAPLTRSLPILGAADIYSSPYDVRVVEAPAAVSWRLKLMARILVSSPLGDVVARKLLDWNHVGTLVELADAIQRDGGDGSGKEWAVGAEPLIRLTTEQHEWHLAAAEEEENARALRMSEHYGILSGDATKPKYNSLYDFHKAYQNGDTTPIAVLAKLLEFVHRVDSKLRCIEQLNVTGARLAAAESTERWKANSSLGVWDGVPVLVKSELALQGLRLTKGQQMGADGLDFSQHNDLLVNRLLQAGAIVMGTTVMHERGVQPTGFNPWYGGPSNPHDLERLPGGSSSGSAVAVATGMVPVAVGFDGGGSIRIPAAWSGTVGLATGYARIPFDGGFQNVISVVKSGVLCATVDDATEALLLLGKPLSEQEGRDLHPYYAPYGGNGPPPPHSKTRWSDRAAPSRPVRIGVFWEWVSHRPIGSGAGTTGGDDAVYKSFSDTLRTLTEKKSGQQEFVAVNFTMPHMHSQALAHGILISAMFAFVSLPELFRGSSRRETPEQDDDLQPATEIQIKLGSQITALELIACHRIRNFALSHWRKLLLEQVDVVLTPTTPMTALKRPWRSDEIGLSDTGLFVQMMRYIWLGNLVGLPGLAVPAGTDSDGMPISLQVICLHWHEADCLEVGRVIERLHQNKRPIPPEEYFANVLEA